MRDPAWKCRTGGGEGRLDNADGGDEEAEGETLAGAPRGEEGTELRLVREETGGWWWDGCPPPPLDNEGVGNGLGTLSSCFL